MGSLSILSLPLFISFVRCQTHGEEVSILLSPMSFQSYITLITCDLLLIHLYFKHINHTYLKKLQINPGPRVKFLFPNSCAMARVLSLWRSIEKKRSSETEA